MGGQARGRWNLFLWHISILFHQCNNKKIYQQFLLLFTLYILHIVHIDVFWCIFPFSWKVNFWLQEMYLLPQFLTLMVETHHHFVGYLIANSAAISKKLFSICFQKKITQNHKQLHKNVKFKNIYIYFSTFYFLKIKKTGIAAPCA